MGLTFDDGPDARNTGGILDLLAEHDATATFFLLADQAARLPTLVTRIVQEGHEVALHGMDHRRLTRLPRAEVTRSLEEGQRALEELCGRRIRWFRPPSGAQTLSTYFVARRLGMLPVVWSRDAADWYDDAPDLIAARALLSLEPGAIILFHDGLQGDPDDVPDVTTFDRAAAVRLILAGLDSQGYRAMSVSRLIAHGRPHRTAWFRP